MLAAAPTITTARLVLRRPRVEDAEAIYTGYAGDPDVTKYMSWPMSRSAAETRERLTAMLREWDDEGVGSYVIEKDGVLIGSTGLHLEAPHHATTGYILARSAWGHGYATEACRAMVQLGRVLGFARVDAHCHAEHVPSARVLEKSGMTLEGILRKHSIFPHLSPLPQDIRMYAWTA